MISAATQRLCVDELSADVREKNDPDDTPPPTNASASAQLPIVALEAWNESLSRAEVLSLFVRSVLKAASAGAPFE